ncbi:DUF1501 domain-containing protein [Rhizobium sp. TRM96647]|uniref:DUF1501 domain-containing protein n=1 Tax=unclassified Rhizobium TaxID=2613769 RepID=UPI0021E7520C|nr:MULTISPECIES: DUF1501 domain-containing protein [unclassified Rhizobium]MCV3737707.1 DUF1501 domain-containing protein [Rhizobium sp. TRM96647]MCV3759562.1 DUF1501 domain-containing protein [Rhizobium sp. TRM96650]
MTNEISRRTLLGAACCLAASPVVTPVSFAAVPGDNRLVTIVLRGAMDGLALVQPYGDPALPVLRPKLALTPERGLLDLDGFFGLHPLAEALMPLWRSRELGFVHATSTPYRSGRSHFDGQDMLESGGAALNDERTGWLNRAIASIPRSAERRAIDVTTTSELILSGPNPVDVWSTRADLDMAEDEQMAFVRLYRNDPVFAAAMGDAMDTDLFSDRIYGDERRNAGVVAVARLAAGMLSGEHRIASFTINGWDTHVGQERTFKRPVTDLCTAILTLKANLSPQVWRKTAILAITEFGRTARENGSGGTDHGTGGLAIIAGGAVAGGRVYGTWPGLAETALLDDRDLTPTTDLRQLAAAMLYRQFDVPARAIDNAIFPGLSFDRSAAYLRG